MKLALTVVLLFLAGCTSLNDVRRQSRDSGQLIEFKAGPDVVQRAAKEALEHGHYKIVEAKPLDEKTFQFIGSMGAGWQSWGQYARIIIQEVGADQTTARITTTARVSANVTEDTATTAQAIELYLKDLVDLYSENVETVSD